jgi:mono/diheme cytochrome c family protein
MRKPLLLITLLIGVIYACNQSGKRVPNSLLNTGKLSSQFFTVDITKDTVLRTKKNGHIKIPKGAITATGTTTVQLEIKEAYSMRDILRAGLFTQSDGRPLSSAGMIYIDAVGENNVRVTGEISVAIPALYTDNNMKLFKGEVQSDSTVNWTDPSPVLADTNYSNMLERGKTIFTDNCARCHALDKDLTGPALAHMEKRFSEEGVPEYFAFTRSPAKVLASGNPYYNCLFQKWAGTPMPEFPQLTDADLHVLYSYIQNESDRLALPVRSNDLLDCYEKCREYERLEAERNSLIREHSTQDPRPVPATAPATETTSIPTDPPPPTPDLVGWEQESLIYYQFNIENFGWYNVDILMKDMDGLSDSELMVRVRGEYRQELQLYLAVPSIRLFARGGPLEGKEGEYGFYTKDGKIPLPLGTKAYIIGMRETSESVQYGINVFTTAEKQQFELNLKNATIDEFNKALNSLGLEELKITAAETKNATAIRQIDTALSKINLPPDCKCLCEQMEKNGNRVDSSRFGY